ncbi:hypothetical protein KDJ56_16820 [Brevibacillus composti]|uniref:DUF3238 domain-containing protein n=1 Tax=Brevibacillus composti TaxID=2796470 RepID=A0A7T5EJ91_9BACL|nr:hypothetical protein [Brevibacillus composti]QQE73548.1 hypothetical protein JD108_16875 [Brevibacillus composti]QUO40630.1 hypothetical protein KDJ56_16820 [Brevibacillus composti]
MKKRLMGLFSGLISVVILSTPVYAEDVEHLELAPVISKENQIELSWNKIGERYQVFSNGELIYDGEDTSYKHVKLYDSTPYSYLIKAFNKEDEVIDEVNVKTMTRPKENTELFSKASNETVSKMKENPLTDLQIDTITSNKMVIIDWPDIEGVNNYRVFREGEFLFETNESKVVDKRVKQGSQYIYSIEGERQISEEKKVEILRQIKSSGFGATDLASEETFYQAITIIREIDLGEKIELDSTVPVPKKWQLRYRTFIPENMVPNPFPDLDNKYEYFGGDGSDRDFNPADDRYRTHTELRVCIFCNSNGTGASVGITSIDVSPTKAYDSNKELVAVSREGSGDINFRYEPIVDQKNGKVEFVFDHAAGNPLVPGPDIDYYYHGRFWGGGTYSVDGGNDLAPSHEFSIIEPGSNRWVIKHATAHRDFNRLFPPLDHFFNFGR